MLTVNHEIHWSDHFHARLMERFGLVLKPEHKLEIEEMIKNEEIFCVLQNRQGCANIYGIIIEGHDVMVLFRPKLNSILTVYRLNWLAKENGVWVKKKTTKPPVRSHFKLRPKIKNRDSKYKIDSYVESFF